MAPSDADTRFMRMALEEAKLGLGRVEPNPMVGCVLVSHGEVMAKGHHRFFGGDHAEVDALRQLSDQPNQTDLTAYVTLEPCSHFGKTPPCTRALIEAGVRRVVVAMRDPFEHVDGSGIDTLRKAGIEVCVGVLQAESQELNRAYLKRLRVGRPWVIAKWAMTMDGRIATVTHQSQWITSPESRRQVHQLRSRMDAVMVGMGTVRADNPRLTARLPDGQTPARNALRVVFCENHLPEVDAHVVCQTGLHPTLLVVSPNISDRAVAPMVDKGCEVIRWANADRLTAVKELLGALAQRGCTNVLLEGGGELVASFFAIGEVDEAHVYIGAKAFGGRDAPGPIGGPGIQRVADAERFRLQATDVFGDDIRLVYASLR